MQKISSIVSFQKEDQEKLVRSYAESLQDPKFRDYISLLPIEDITLMKYTSRLEDACQEFYHCQDCKGLEFCQNKEKGFLLTPENHGKTISFSYVSCPFLRRQLESTSYQKNIHLFDMPKKLRDASMKNIKSDDKKRENVIKYLVQFCKEYPKNKNQTGIYLHGSFGSGKTYLIVALFNELAKQNISSAIVYYPEFLRTLKESFSTDYKEKYHFIKTAPLLLLDDIGAENLTPWARDEVLGPILQYRMEEELPTFFTSNLTLEELENHLSQTTSGIDKIKARRIIERIKQLTIDMELVSKNRR